MVGAIYFDNFRLLGAFGLDPRRPSGNQTQAKSIIHGRRGVLDTVTLETSIINKSCHASFYSLVS